MSKQTPPQASLFAPKPAAKAKQDRTPAKMLVGDFWARKGRYSDKAVKDTANTVTSAKRSEVWVDRETRARRGK